MIQLTKIRLCWLVIPVTFMALVFVMSTESISAAPVKQSSDSTSAGTTAITDTVDSEAKSAIDYIMYLRSQPQDDDTCAMTVMDGQLVIDPAIANPTMSCPNMFGWKLFVESLQQEFWKNWASDQYAFPQEGPLPLCAAGAEDDPICCTPGSVTNPGYDDPENPGKQCPYFPGDHVATDGEINVLETNNPAVSQEHHFERMTDHSDLEPGRMIRQEMAELVFRNKPMFDYIFENDLYNTDGLAKVFARANTAMQSNAPFHQRNVTGELVEVIFPIDAVMIKTNWLHEERAAELGIEDDPDNPYIKMTLNSKTTDNNAEIFEPGVHYLIAFHVSSKHIPNWFWATFEHVNNPGRCDMIGCNDSFGYQSPQAISTDLYNNFIAPNQRSDDLLLPTTIFDPGQIYTGDVRSPALGTIFTDLNIGSSDGDGVMPAPTDRGWLSYRLKGTQTNFTDNVGYPTLLGNSVTEGGFVGTSSCMGCHARATFGPDGTTPLGVFVEKLDENGYAQSSFGPPDPQWYYSSSSKPTLQALQFDFVWGVLFAQPLATDSATADAASKLSTADPFAYCADVGTIDTPEGDFGGPSNPGIPEVIAAGLRQAAGIADDAPITENSYWRCMDGKVYACFIGANLPCASKSDTSTTPTEAMNEFCTGQPDADAIPAFVTGHDTVYSWSCVDGEAKAGEQVMEVDAQGYPADIWYEIDPATTLTMVTE